MAQLTYEASAEVLRYDLGVFDDLMNKGKIDPNVRDSQNNTLFWECQTSSQIGHLLGLVDIEAKNKDGNTFTHSLQFRQFIDPGNSKHYGKLLFNPNVCDNEGRTLLSHRCGKSDIVNLLKLDPKHFTEELRITDVFKNPYISQEAIDILKERNINISPLLSNASVLQSYQMLKSVLQTNPDIALAKKALEVFPKGYPTSLGLLTGYVACGEVLEQKPIKPQDIQLSQEKVIFGTWEVPIAEFEVLDEIKVLLDKSKRLDRLKGLSL